jgi:hypothetical protein
VAKPTTIIDEVISDYDDVDPTDADYATLRAKYRRFLQHVYNYVWNVREWEWTYKESSLTILSAGNNVALPNDFLSIGQQGSLFDNGRGVALRPKAKWIVEKLRRQGPLGGLNADIFAVWQSKIQIPYTVGSNTAFTLFHRFRPDTLLDDGATEMLLPDRYAETVLKPALVWRSQTKKQDARPTWGEQFQAGLSHMAAAENPLLAEPAKMPLALKGVW